jgi:acetylornithine deacetylase/succinyl-diaminopimelate desuccinylase-like protein
VDDRRPESVFRHIDQHQAAHVARLVELIRVPSISAENRGMQECAELLASYYRALGCKRVEIVATEGQPVVYGEYDAGKPVTLLVYVMYDVKQVVGEQWTLVDDPFAPQVVERSPFRACLVGRGAVNQKGPLGALLNAVESIRAAGQELPVNLLFVSDGEEEIGSPHLFDFATAHLDWLARADAAIFPTASQNLRGVPTISLGCKGSAPF